MDNNMVNLANRFISETGIDIGSFYVEITPYSEMVCYTNDKGREYDLPISDENLAKVVILKLKELGVRVIELK